MKKVLSIIFSLALIVSVMAFPFETNAITLADDELPVDGWTFLTSSTNANNGVPSEKPENVIDGSAVTHWHTTISPKAEGPHFITVVLPTVQKIGGYRYTPRSNMGAGTCTKYEISVSIDDVNYEKVAEGTWIHNAQVKTVSFSKQVDAKYVKLTILEGVGGFGSAAEIRLLKPTSAVGAATSTGSVTSTVSTTGTASTASSTGYAPLSELPVDGWTFLTSSTNANNGVPQEKPENVIDGSAVTHWHTTINPKAEGPHFITVVLPTVQKIGGYRYTPRSNMGAGTCTKYEISVSLDNVNYEKVAEGTWAYNAQAKTVEFSKDVETKYVKLTILEGIGGFGSAAEIRLLSAKSGAAGGATGTPIAYVPFSELPVDGWTFLTSSTNANNGVPSEKPENVIDGSAVTHWHTTINPKAEGPHFITVVLPTVQKIGGYRYTPRSNMGAGTCTKYEISVSLDNVNYEKVAEGTWAYNAQAKNVYFNKDVEARYVKLTILEGVGGFGSAAEIRLLSPKEGTDGMIYNYTELDVELPVTGWKFLASSTNANNGVPAEVPENVIDGNTRTHWHTMINPKAEPPHYLTIVLPEITEIGGYRYYPRASGPAGVCSKYEIYASLDNVHFEKLAAGEWSTSTEKKTVYFSKNVRAKYVRLQILKGTYDFGSAGEIRLMAPNPQKKTEDLVANFMFEDASSGKAELGQTGWSVVASSVNTDINGNVLEKAENLIDGDVNSFWTTKIDPKAEGPHEVTVIFPGVISMSGYRYYPRAIGLAGICTKYELYASDNGTDFYQIASGDWAGNNDAKTIEFVCNLKAKALRLVMLESFGGYGSGGEIKILAPDDGLSTITPAEYYAESQKYVINGYVFDGTKIHTLGETNLIAHRMIDGAESSNWYSPVTVGGEQTRLDVEFPYSYTLKGIRYLGRQDGHTAGNFKKIKVQASNDAKTYQDVGEYSLEVKSTPIDVNFNTDVTAKYLRITVLEGQDNYAACAEISFLQNAKQHQDDSLKDEEKYVLQIGSNAIHVTKAGVTKTVTIDAAPYIYQSSTMIPLRGLLEEMGCAVTWSGETETIEVKSNFDLMKFSIENPTVLINGGRYASPVAPQITESRTYIPLRFVSENLGYNVYWNGDTREITISTK